jgi:hypothetical protein
MTKICKICCRTLPRSNFNKKSSSKDGFQGTCRECASVRNSERYKKNQHDIRLKQSMYYRNNLEKFKAKSARYRKLNTEKLKVQNKKYQTDNKLKIKARRSAYYQSNSDSIKLQRSVYRKEHPQEIAVSKAKYYTLNRNTISTHHAEYRRNRACSDPLFKFVCSIRSMMCSSFKRKKCSKTYPTTQILGCSIEIFVQHIQSLFQPGMTLENHGKWHLDHIVPLATAKTEEDVIRLCHYTNLQPLWYEDHKRKTAFELRRK